MPVKNSPSPLQSSDLKENYRYWHGPDGDAYIYRNQPRQEWLECRQRWFSGLLKAMSLSSHPSFLEVGANTGMNFSALMPLFSGEFHATDLNEKSCQLLKQDKQLRDQVQVTVGDIMKLPYRSESCDVVMTCAVLIHIHPDKLLQAAQELVRVSRKYLLCAEYYSMKPEEVVYRGHSGILFKRDFGGFFLDHCPELGLVDYGFLWGRVEPSFDDIYWWLFEKNNR